MLLARVGQVAYHYAPPVQGSYEDKGLYFTLNPGRPDRSVGSFYIHLDGDKAGKWTDHATGEFGDVLDLIKLSLNLRDTADALREARAFLGLANADPATIRQREQAAARARQHRATAAEAARDKRARAARNAHRLYLSAHARIADTPVEFYLRDSRGIDLRQLGHQPGCLRYLPDCYFKHIDPETGDVIQGNWPAMIASVNNAQGATVAVHRTYLALRGGRWAKADLPAPKKVLGDYAGAWINIWKGRDADGRFGKPISQLTAPARVYIAEGIEDALTAALLLPEARHIAAISLSNLGQVNLPAQVTEITLVADRDDNAEARAALQRAVGRHQAAGRTVRIWQNTRGGKDLNDAMRALQAGQTGEGAA